MSTPTTIIKSTTLSCRTHLRSGINEYSVALGRGEEVARCDVTATPGPAGTVVLVSDRLKWMSAKIDHKLWADELLTEDLSSIIIATVEVYKRETERIEDYLTDEEAEEIERNARRIQDAGVALMVAFSDVSNTGVAGLTPAQVPAWIANRWQFMADHYNVALPALLHYVEFRKNPQCTGRFQNGKRCTTMIDMSHINPRDFIFEDGERCARHKWQRSDE